jgi:hypothetical protein
MLLVRAALLQVRAFYNWQKTDCFKCEGDHKADAELLVRHIGARPCCVSLQRRTFKGDVQASNVCVKSRHLVVGRQLPVFP